MSVLTYLDVCTCHISAKTNDFLGSVAGKNSIGQTVAEYEYGYFISVPDNANEYHESIPDDLRKVLDYAREKGCLVLRLDADADRIDPLPSFDW